MWIRAQAHFTRPHLNLSLSHTYNVAIKSPFIPNDCVLEEAIGTAGDSIHSIVTAHDALGPSL